MKLIKNIIVILSYIILITTLVIINYQNILNYETLFDLLSNVVIFSSSITFIRYAGIVCGKEINFFRRDAWEMRTKIEHNKHMKKFPDNGGPISDYIFGILSISGDIISYIVIISFLLDNIFSIYTLSLIPVFISIYMTSKLFYMEVLFNNKGLKEKSS